MPKTPIHSRTMFYDTLKDGTIRFLDWYLVNTELGAMIESRPVMMVDPTGKVNQVDIVDASVNRIEPMSEDKFFTTFNHGGRQVPIDFRY